MALAVKFPSMLWPEERGEELERPSLSLVAPARRRYVKVFAVIAPLLVVMCAVVALRAHMAQQQLRIDRLNYDISRARQHFDTLRAERASLQSPEVLIDRARQMGMVPSVGVRIVEIPASVAAEVAATVGKIDADVAVGAESPLDEFGRLKPAVVGAP